MICVNRHPTHIVYIRTQLRSTHYTGLIQQGPTPPLPFLDHFHHWIDLHHCGILLNQKFIQLLHLVSSLHYKLDGGWGEGSNMLNVIHGSISVFVFLPWTLLEPCAGPGGRPQTGSGMAGKEAVTPGSKPNFNRCARHTTHGKC